jgi:SOS-response transcriptional repressor LexA
MPSMSHEELASFTPITEWLHIPVLSTIGAARSFYDIPIRGWIDIQPPLGARPGDEFCGGLVSGESLAEDEIHDGDTIVFRLTFEREDIKPGAICAVLTPYGFLLKHLYFTLDGKVRLVSANPLYEDLVLDAEDVTVQGLAVQIVRQL